MATDKPFSGNILSLFNLLCHIRFQVTSNTLWINFRFNFRYCNTERKIVFAKGLKRFQKE